MCSAERPDGRPLRCLRGRVLARRPHFVCLQVVVRDSQQRQGIDRLRIAAREQITDHVIGFDARMVLDVAQHRRGQRRRRQHHPLHPLDGGRLGPVAVVLGNRAAFGEHRLQQATAVRRGENVAHRAAEQRRARGERREEHPFFPHPRDHVVAERRIESRAAEHIGHRAHARRFAAREFAEGDPVRVVEVHDALLAIERRRDHAQPAEHLGGAEPVAQHFEMAHPVEHRQDQRLRADFVEQFLGRRALAGDHVRVVVGRDQREPVLRGEFAPDLLAILGVAVVGHNLAAVAARRGHLRGRRILRHHDRRGNAEHARRQRDRLRMVAGRERDDTVAALLRVEARQRVERAAELECAHALQVLALEEHLRAECFVDRPRRHHRRAVRMAFEPGTSNCQIVNNVLVDTASYGLRLVGSAVSGVLGSLPQVTSGGAPVAECGKFVSSYTWGSVRTVDLSIGSEQASSLPVQIIGDLGTTNVPSSCTNGGASANSASALGANGILGIGPAPVDCGTTCATSTSTNNNMISDFDRAAPHGTGAIKAGLNYAMSLHSHEIAVEKGFTENLYLDAGKREFVEETGGANVLFVDEKDRLVVPKSDSILPSITRKSLIYVAEHILHIPVEERAVRLEELKSFKECGLCGTAAVISPVGKIQNHEEEICFPSGMEKPGKIMDELYRTLIAIQDGEMEAPEGWIRHIQ